MNHVKPGHKTARAQVTPAYGMRPVGGYGIRGWRVFCPACGHLSKLHENVRGAQGARHRHTCGTGEQ